MNKADMLYDLSAVWAAAKDVFPYFDRIDFDFDEFYYQCIDKVLSVKDEYEFHMILKSFLESLNDAHTRYHLPEKYTQKTNAQKLERPSFSMDGGVLTIKINDLLFDHSDFVRQCLTDNPDASMVRLDIRDNIGGNTFYGAKIAELFISGVFHGCQKWTQSIKANNLASASQIANMSEERIQRYIDDGLMQDDSYKNDLKILKRTKYEEYIDTYGSQDHKAIYDGPLEVLIGKGTMSAAEDMTAMFKSSKRGVLVGNPTYGSTGSPYILHLRCGGRAQIVSVGYRLLDGTEFIGKGIEPDVITK